MPLLAHGDEQRTDAPQDLPVADRSLSGVNVERRATELPALDEAAVGEEAALAATAAQPDEAVLIDEAALTIEIEPSPEPAAMTETASADPVDELTALIVSNDLEQSTAPEQQSAELDPPIAELESADPAAVEKSIGEANETANDETVADEAMDIAEAVTDIETDAATEAGAEENSAKTLEATPEGTDVEATSADEAKPDTDERSDDDAEKAALPRARNIDLTEPVSELEVEVEVISGDDAELIDSGLGEELVLLGARVEPGTSTRLSWSPQDTFEGIAVPTPVLVVNGTKPGPVLCLTGAVHGDEINGIEVIRRVMYDLNPADVSGAVIGVPIVNQVGFRRNSRYLSDRRDLNRYFPGTPDGSSAARIAHSFFQEVIVNCDMLVDIHTGSFHRTNLSQLRADLHNPAVAEFARGFGDMVVLHGEGQPGTLRREAVEIGIPAITVEAGEPMRIQEESVADGVKGIRTLMTSLGMSSRPFFWSQPRPAYYRSYWVRASRGGVLMSSVELGAQVREGDVLGVVVNPITNHKSEIVSPFRGRVIGMALNQVVMPGFAAYHVGMQASEEEMRTLSDNQADQAGDGTAYWSDVPYPAGPDTYDSTEE